MPAPPSHPVELRTDNLCKSFGEHAVLRGIAISIFSGDIVAIVGGSGSGKTVLLDHMVGLLAPDSGRILVADHDATPEASGQLPLLELAALSGDDLDRVRLHWSVVFQRNALFSGTVRDNIALWLREHTELTEKQIDARIRASLKAVSLDVNDVINKDRDSLSGGMAKRVAIARAIAADPIVMFYDEPTTGLDPVAGAHIHELIWKMHNLPVGRALDDAPDTDHPALSPAGTSPTAAESSHPSTSGPLRTTIIVTHDKDLLRRLRPRVIMLHQSRLAFDGPYDQFEKSNLPPAREYLAAMPVLHARATEWEAPHRGRFG